ncbi:SDR family oxidoreductase [Oleiharenicola sp. Vm1]|uniref:SDR family oxidoreductase n=1 Tax=Oleiharenicola sp. Vm1 TaxID=3398393 RepID=UPI0039F5B107
MKNKTLLITGGTTGIGLATAQLLAADGARVIVTGRNPETLAAARAQLPASALVLKSDSGQLADAQALGSVLQQHGVTRLDGAFLNAGIGKFGPIDAATPQDFEDQFAINVRGPYFQIQSLLPLLANPSAIVINASVVAGVNFEHASIYSATKAAVVSLGRSLGAELAPRGIRVNTLSPGPIETPIFGKLGLPAEAAKNLIDSLGQGTLLKRAGQPAEIARLARFLLSEDSSFIVGEDIVADGGVRHV